jgi:mono/diheme cytochrome c family protein
MKVRNGLLVTGVIFATAAAGLAQDSGKTSPGQQVFQSRCVTCHGADGSGNTMMGKQLQAKDLRSPEVQKLSPREMKQVVSSGQGNMPAFGDRLSDDEIAQVVAYVRTIGKKAK